MHEMNQTDLPTQFLFLLHPPLSCFVLMLHMFFLQGEAERAPSGEAEVGGEDHGSV